MFYKEGNASNKFVRRQKYMMHFETVNVNMNSLCS